MHIISPLFGLKAGFVLSGMHGMMYLFTQLGLAGGKSSM